MKYALAITFILSLLSGCASTTGNQATNTSYMNPPTVQAVPDMNMPIENAHKL